MDMTDDELVQMCDSYDGVMYYYQKGQLKLNDYLLKLLRAEVQAVYEEIKYRMEEKRQQEQDEY